jgi:hypothetical protein
MDLGRPQTAPPSDHRGTTHATPRSSVEVRLPRTSYEAAGDVSADFDDLYQRNPALQSSFLNQSTAGHSAAPHVSFTHGEMSPVPSAASAAGASHGPQPSSKADMQGVISALEEEFEQLNLEYRRLLNTVQTSDTATGGGSDLARQPFAATQESIEKQAGELVSVIQKLHKKGEQLRTLKSSP